jgi:ATP-dependent exoDNAse (exonuclease V) alpha subunit
VDDVLLVASSKSFAAVNREQFYVSISRGRERVHVFTNDADLLARRVNDSHERKAAVELQALRDVLAKLGFLPQPLSTQPLRRRKQIKVATLRGIC